MEHFRTIRALDPKHAQIIAQWAEEAYDSRVNKSKDEGKFMTWTSTECTVLGDILRIINDENEKNRS